MLRVLALLIVCSLAAQSFSFETTWTHVNPLPSAANYYGVAAGSGRLVVTGSYWSRTSFISSNTVSNWTEAELERNFAVGSSAASYLVAYDPTWGFIAVPSAIGGNGYSWIWESPNGAQWNVGTQRVSYGNTLVASNGVFISTGGVNTVYSSKDGGKSWASIPMESYTNTPSVIGQRFFVPVGQKYVFSSQDGLEFNLYYNFSSFPVPPVLGAISSISHVWGSPDGSIVALVPTNTGALILRSNTVVNPSWKIAFKWDSHFGYGYFARAASSDSLFVSVPTGSMNHWSYWVSKDNGLTWAPYQGQDIAFGPIVSAGEYLVVFGRAGKLSVSEDGGQSWILHNNGITERIQNTWYSPNLNSLVLATSKAIYNAQDGIFTSNSAVSRPNPNLISLIEFGSGPNARFAGVDQNGSISISPVTGGPWVVRQGPSVTIPRTRSYYASALAYAEDQDIWVVTLQTQQAFSILPAFYFSSGNTGSWNFGVTDITYFDIASVQGLVYAQKTFVALIAYQQAGFKYGAFSSPNGSLWTLNTLFPVQGATFGCRLNVLGPRDGGQRFFVFCDSSKTPAYISNDGVNWKPINLPGSSRYVNYLEGSKLWIATGYEGFYTSPDLSNWSKPIQNPAGNSMVDLAVQNPVSGAVAAVSTFDNTIVATNSI